MDGDAGVDGDDGVDNDVDSDANVDDTDDVYGDDDEVFVAVEGYLLCPEKLAGGLRWGQSREKMILELLLYILRHDIFSYFASAGQKVGTQWGKVDS